MHVCEREIFIRVIVLNEMFLSGYRGLTGQKDQHSSTCTKRGIYSLILVDFSVYATFLDPDSIYIWYCFNTNTYKCLLPLFYHEGNMWKLYTLKFTSIPSLHITDTYSSELFYWHRMVHCWLEEQATYSSFHQWYYCSSAREFGNQIEWLQVRRSAKLF